MISREGASNRKNGIAFYDTSDPAHPKLISEYTATVTGGVHSAFVDGHYVYLTDDATGSMRVIDFADVRTRRKSRAGRPRIPLAGMIRTKEGEQIAGRYIHDLQVKDGLAYLAYWHDGLVILDVGAGIKGGSPGESEVRQSIAFQSQRALRQRLARGHALRLSLPQLRLHRRRSVPGDIRYQVAEACSGARHGSRDRRFGHQQSAQSRRVSGAGRRRAQHVGRERVMYVGYYSGGGRIVDVSGELRGDLYQAGTRGCAHMDRRSGWLSRRTLPFTWGAQPHKGLIYFNDIQLRTVDREARREDRKRFHHRARPVSQS